MLRSILPVFLFLTLALPGAGSGQEQADTAQIPGPEPAPPLDLAEALGGVNATFRDVGELRARVADRARIQSLQDQIEAVEDRFATSIEADLSAVPVDQMDRGRLQEVLLLLPRLAGEAERVGQEVTDALVELTRLQDSLRSYDDRWSRIAEAADAEDLSDELAAVVETLLAVTDSARAEAASRSGELVALEGRLVSLETRIAELELAAGARDRALLADLVEQDSGPIWTLLDGDTPAELARDLALVPSSVGAALTDLWEAYRGRVLFHGVVGLLILSLVLGFSRSEALAASPELETARRIFGHPLAVAVILTLALTEPLYPTAQPGVEALSTVLFLAAELVVLQAALPFVSPTALWAGGAFLGFSRLAFLLPFDTPGHRLAFLLSSAGGIVLLWALDRLLRRYTAHGGGRWLHWLRRLFLAFALLLAVAVVANVVGMVGLAVLVTRSMVRSFLAALGLLTLAVVLRALVQVGLRTGPLQRLHSVRSERAGITESVFRIIDWAAFLTWVWATLVAFRIDEPLVRAVTRVLEFQVQLGAVSFAPATLAIFGLSIWLAVNVSRVTRFFLDQDVLPRLSLPRGVPRAISTSVHYVIVGLALAFGVTAMGLDLTSLAFVVGALGVGIGFGLQNIMNNFISGLILLFERPIQVGDEVRIGELTGTMRRIGIRASVVRAYDGSEVIVPNGDLISQQVVNYTLSDRLRRLELQVGVAYGTDLDHAREAILKALSSVEQVLAEPAPMVLFNGFGDSSLDFRVFFWVPDFGLGLETGSALGMAVNRAFREADVEIPFPQRDLHLRSAPVLEEWQRNRSPDHPSPNPEGP